MAKRAEREVTIIAPFVKIGALKRILDEIRDDVPVRLYTRWRPDEIAVGVSDVGAWHLISSRQYGSMYLCHPLHAKCYVFDSEASVGSANVTSKALGWHSTPNLEIQVQVSALSEQVVSLMRDLTSCATVVTDELAARFEALAVELGKVEFDTDQMLLAEQPATHEWLPNTRQPSDLYLAYSGRKDELSKESQITAVLDLTYLGIPPGLSRRDFESCVAAVMMQHRFFAKVEELSKVRRRFGEYRQFVSEYLSEYRSDRKAVDAWQTCLRWLVHFCADNYEIDTPNYTEVLVRRRKTFCD